MSEPKVSEIGMCWSDHWWKPISATKAQCLKCGRIDEDPTALRDRLTELLEGK